MKTIPFILLGTLVLSAARGSNQLINGDFGADLADWASEGSVSVSDGVATLFEGGEAPVLYQAVAVSGYVYELRFDLYLGGLSSAVGTGQLDTAVVLLYLGTDPAGLIPESAADESILIEADANGLRTVTPNAQVVPHAALAPGWYSAVVEVASDFEAIAPAAMIVDGNGLADSSLSIDNVSLVALDRGRFANISNRGGVGTGANIMIPGFVIEGQTRKSLVIRGAGPSLGALGVDGTIVDPQLKLFYRVPAIPGGDPQPDEIKGENDDWEQVSDLPGLKAAMAKVGAFGFSPGSADAALLAEDLAPGAYTVQLSGVDGVTGVALAEIYDLGSSVDGPTELVNISNRGYIGSGSEVQIPGFVIGGTRGRVVLVRAVGPTLGDFGVPDTIEDPRLELYDQSRVGEPPLYMNDNWGDAINAVALEATAARVGAFPLGAGSKDASILTSLPPGSYTAVARGVDATTGVALVEVYLVTSNHRPTAFSDTLVVTPGIPNVLPLDEILADDMDPENDALAVCGFTQPDEGAIAWNDDGDWVYTPPTGFSGETRFSYRVSDGEYESASAAIVLEVRAIDAVVWQGGSSESFSDPANWVGGQVPGKDDPVRIAPVGGGTVVIDADTEVASIRVGGSGSEATLKMGGYHTLTAAGGVEVLPGSTFELAMGTLDTTEDAVIRGQLIWRNGAMTGQGTTIIAEGATVIMDYQWGYLRGGRDLINFGSMTQTWFGGIIADSPDSTSTITNASGAHWAILPVSPLLNYVDTMAATVTLNFVNAGTLSISGLYNAFFGSDSGTFNLTNTGLLHVQSGGLVVGAEGTHSLGGRVDLGIDAELSFFGGTAALSGAVESASGSTLTAHADCEFTVASGAEFAGEGTLSLGSGTLTLIDSMQLPSVDVLSGTLVADEALSIDNLTVYAGTLSGSGDVTVTGALRWGGHGVMTGDSATIIADGATAALVHKTVYLRGGRDFINHGTLTQADTCNISTDTSDSTSTITNASGASWTVSMDADQSIACPDHATATLHFINDGTLSHNGSERTTLGSTIGTFALTNTGTIDVNSGTMHLEGSSAVLGPSGTLRLTTNGSTTPLTRSGALAIGGTLEVDLAEGYNPPNGTKIRLIDYTSKTGVFDPIKPPQGRALAESYAADGLDVTIN